LPAAGAQCPVFDDQVALQGMDQRPGEFDRRGDDAAGAAHGDPQPVSCRGVDGGVERPGGDQQSQGRQSAQQVGVDGGALPHRHHDLAVGQSGDEFVAGGDVLAQCQQVDGPRDGRPVHGFGDALVVVEHRDFQRGSGGGHQNASGSRWTSSGTGC